MNPPQELINIFKALSSVEEGAFLDMKEFLTQNYFTASKNHLLILQNMGHYGVYFIRSSDFDDELLQGRHLQEFWELVGFIQYMINQFYLCPLTDVANHKPIEVLSDAYPHPEITDKFITLNEEGDFSVKPHEILNKEGQIKYKGLVYEGNLYWKLLKLITGKYVVSSSGKAWIQEYNVTDNIVSNRLHEPKPLKRISNELASKKKNEEQEISNKTSKAVIDDQNKEKIHSKIMIYLALLLTGFIGWYIYDYFFESTSLKVPESIVKEHQILNKKSDSILKVLSVISTKKTGANDLSSDSPSNVHYGIDISHYQGTVVDDISQKDSLSFVICKATQGIHYVDPYFFYNWKKLKEDSLLRGAYHFYQEGEDPTQQANHYWSTIKELAPNDIRPILDVELRSLSSNEKLDINQFNKDLITFLELIEKKSKKIPIIYTNLDFANNHLVNPLLSQFPLWIAEYDSAKKPKIPTLWADKGFLIWQRSSSYNLDSEKTDFDVYYGSLSKLN